MVIGGDDLAGDGMAAGSEDVDGAGSVVGDGSFFFGRPGPFLGFLAGGWYLWSQVSSTDETLVK